LNNEFLKGIKARERVVVLKTVIHLDSQQISLYKDSIVPSYQQMIEVSKKEVYDLNRTIDRKDAEYGTKDIVHQQLTLTVLEKLCGRPSLT